ncbi:hypothetical protein [Ulvibacter litoralis]|uniref:Uncharacterized protein n=1 Tax=Ulvibacter litoralis TaxID=227084 RepID=A0A1G7HGE7_9FLAO|nr:hypothetical protein [Ulvibacter litoralis]SDE99542.1 hypothetical protein SAMN05421855_10483 [Ulvibacter litoralis]
MENIIFKTSIIIGAALALPRMVLGLFEFLKWFFSIILVFFFPTRGTNALKVVSKNFHKQTVFNSKQQKTDESLLSPEPSG